MASVKIRFLGLLVLLISYLAAANRILLDSGTSDDNDKDREVGSSWDKDEPNNKGSVQFGGSWEVGGGKGGQKGFNFGGSGGVGGGVSVGVGVGVGGGKGGWSGSGDWGGGGGAQYPMPTPVPVPVPVPTAPGGGGKGGWSKGAGGGKGGWSGGSWGSWGSGSGWSAGPCAACPPQCLRVNWVGGKTMDKVATEMEHGTTHNEPMEMEDGMQDNEVMEHSPDNE